MSAEERSRNETQFNIKIMKPDESSQDPAMTMSYIDGTPLNGSVHSDDEFESANGSVHKKVKKKMTTYEQMEYKFTKLTHKVDDLADTVSVLV
jgi:hypothetical protein